MKKVLVYIKGFSDSERVKLARMTAIWISNNSVNAAVLNSLINVCAVFFYFGTSLLNYVSKISYRSIL